MLIEIIPIRWIVLFGTFALLALLCMFMYWWGGRESGLKLKDYKKRICSHVNWVDIEINGISICTACGRVKKMSWSDATIKQLKEYEGR